MSNRRSEKKSRRSRARFSPKDKERNNRRKDQVYSRKLKVIPTSKIVEKLYEGNAVEPAPSIPLPTRRRRKESSKRESEEEKKNSFAWQPTDFSEKSKDDPEWENLSYFMEGQPRGEEHEFDSLFTPEESDECVYDHYYESSAYAPERKKNNRMCTSCHEDARMCKMERCTIS
mmetsp:Transcript_3214/g.4297  ORF Transcript_3214/g.4297 Transcript_3214/m.4297 type:complete len:173 (+) Transcript_3214:147-665(+)|eukprot:jgi/Bigna1/147057/aug1.128_g21765